MDDSGSNLPPRPAVATVEALKDYLDAWLSDDRERGAEIIKILATVPETFGDQTALAIAADNKRIAQDFLESLEAKREEVKRPYLDATRCVDGTFRVTRDAVEAALRPVAQRMTAAKIELDRKAKAAAEAEARRLREEADRRAAEAQKILTAGPACEINFAFGALERSEIEAARAQHRAEGRPAARGTRIIGPQGSVDPLRLRWAIEVTDIGVLPLKYLEPNYSALSADLRLAPKAPDGKPLFSCPGATVVARYS